MTLWTFRSDPKPLENNFRLSLLKSDFITGSYAGFSAGFSVRLANQFLSCLHFNLAVTPAIFSVVPLQHRWQVNFLSVAICLELLLFEYSIRPKIVSKDKTSAMSSSEPVQLHRF